MTEFDMGKVIYSVTAEDLEKDGYFYNISTMVRRMGFLGFDRDVFRITDGIHKMLLSYPKGKRDPRHTIMTPEAKYFWYMNEMMNAAYNTYKKEFTEEEYYLQTWPFEVELPISKQPIKLIIGEDNTSGLAYHIFKPEES